MDPTSLTQEASPNITNGRSTKSRATAPSAGERTLLLATAPSPLGPILFALHGDALCSLYFADHESKLRRDLQRQFGARALAAELVESSPANESIERIRAALAAYFQGDLRALDPLPREAHGTEFQLRVWSALNTIPAGETRSYAQIATQVGSPKAMRAVGLANGRNPISLAVPCHRVIGADGSLTGYGGGMHRKRWLLAHEQVRGFSGGFDFVGMQTK